MKHPGWFETALVTAVLLGVPVAAILGRLLLAGLLLALASGVLLRFMRRRVR